MIEATQEIQDLLNRYDSSTRSDRREHIEAQLLASIERQITEYFRKKRVSADDAADLWSETRLRLVRHLQQGRIKSPTENFLPRAYAVAYSVYCDFVRRDNPWYSLKCKVEYLTTRSSHRTLFGRWQLQNKTLMGLSRQYGEPMRHTAAYTAFCRDTSPYLEASLPGLAVTDEKAVPLHRLMSTLFVWIETPLEQSMLVTHLAGLRGIEKISVRNFSEITEEGERSLDEVIPAAQPESETFDWEACWNEILTLSLSMRRLLLLSLDRNMLVYLMGSTDPVPVLSEVVDYPEETLRGWLPNLPFSDDTLAELLQTRKNTLHVTRSRARERLHKKIFDSCQSAPDSASSGNKEKRS